MTDPTELPELESIFGELRRGRHICAEDGIHFYHLRDHFEDFERLFSALGFELASHERGFFYFRGDGDIGKRAAQLAVFFFVLVDALGNEGENVREAIFEREHRLGELPHFRLESHRQCLAEVDLHDDEDLEKVVRRLERYGLAETTRRDTLRFRKPAWRFVDLCYAVAQEGDSDAVDEVGERNIEVSR